MGAAELLLMHCHWDPETLLLAWFETAGARSLQLCKAVGLPAAHVPIVDDSRDPSEAAECPVCLDDLQERDGVRLWCGHWCCKDCWGDSIHNAVQAGGDGGAVLRCLAAGCHSAVPTDVAESLAASREDYAAHRRAVIKRHVEDSGPNQVHAAPPPLAAVATNHRASTRLASRRPASTLFCGCSDMSCPKAASKLLQEPGWWLHWNDGAAGRLGGRRGPLRLVRGGLLPVL